YAATLQLTNTLKLLHRLDNAKERCVGGEARTSPRRRARRTKARSPAAPLFVFQAASRTVGTGSARWPPPACGFGAGQSGQSWRRCACSPDKETNNDRGTRRNECALRGRRATRQSNEDRRRFTPDRKRILLPQGLRVQCEQHPGSTRR